MRLLILCVPVLTLLWMKLKDLNTYNETTGSMPYEYQLKNPYQFHVDYKLWLIMSIGIMVCLWGLNYIYNRNRKVASNA